MIRIAPGLSTQEPWRQREQRKREHSTKYMKDKLFILSMKNFHILIKRYYFTWDCPKCRPKDRTSDPLDGGTLDVSPIAREDGICDNLFPVTFDFSICLSFSRSLLHKNSKYTYINQTISESS